MPQARLPSQHMPIVCLAILLIAGCLGRPGPTDAAPSTTTGAADAGFVQANNATGCSRAFIASFPDKGHAQTFLPAGFRAGDSAEFFGMGGAPSGQAVLIVSIARCQSSEWQGAELEAMTGLFVQPPKVHGAAVRGEHFYDLGRVYDDSTESGQALKDLAWPRLGADAQHAYAGEPTRAAQVMVRDANGTVYSASLPGAAAKDTFTQILHLYWWHETPTGLASFESMFRPDGYLGPGSCSMRAGSVPAAVMGSTSCSALFMVGPPFAVMGQFEHRPGVHADP
jgi:hypothetical protein